MTSIRRTADHHKAVPPCGKQKSQGSDCNGIADVRKALQDADYVVTTLRVGGDHSRVMDETIALNAGVIGQETTVSVDFRWQCARFRFCWSTAG